MSVKDFTIAELINNHSFRNWVEGHATPDENEFWDEWIEKSDRNRRCALRAQQELIGVSLRESFLVPDAEEAWGKVDDRIEGKRRKKRLIRKMTSTDEDSGTFWSYGIVQFMRYAAILILVFTGSAAWYFLSDNFTGNPESVSVIEERVDTGFGERKTLTLSDGSEIVLNANSTLTYVTGPAQPGTIEVTLEGEAWFSITSRRSPGTGTNAGVFRVFTEDGSVSVLGTKFAVLTRTESTQVVLEEGEVVVTPSQPEENSPERVILKPDELAEYSRYSTDVKVRPVNTQIYTSWKDPKLVFDQTPVREIIERIEHTYGVQVVVEESGVNDRLISGSAENSGLLSIVSVLRDILSVSIEVDGDTVYIGGKV